MFSDAMSSICSRWRPSSLRSAALSSGSPSATPAVKKPSSTAGLARELFRGIGDPVVEGDEAERSRHLGDAPGMAPAFEFGAEKYPEAILGDFGAEDAGAQRQHVGVVVLAREACGGHVVADGGAHGAVPVGGDRDADAGATDEDAAPGLAGLYRPRQRSGEIRIIHGFRPFGAEVQHLEAESRDFRDQEGLQIKATVVGSDRDHLSHGA